MILAAGLGTRLGALTRDTPKALVAIGGVPILERVARRLIAAGANRLIINTHHHAGQIVEFVLNRRSFGVEVAFSAERERPLETGGGLLQAAGKFRGDSPFFLHNVDILTDFPLERIYDAHSTRSPLATLAVMERPSSRYLLFDDDGLYGRVDEGKGLRIEARQPRGETRHLAFAGIHVISPGFIGLITEEGAFSILDPYLRLAGEGHRIDSIRVDGHAWIDIGKPEQLAEANRLFAK